MYTRCSCMPSHPRYVLRRLGHCHDCYCHCHRNRSRAEARDSGSPRDLDASVDLGDGSADRITGGLDVFVEPWSLPHPLLRTLGTQDHPSRWAHTRHSDTRATTTPVWIFGHALPSPDQVGLGL